MHDYMYIYYTKCSSYLEAHHLYETLDVHLKVPVPT